MIDVTGSMGHIINMVKKNALNLYEDVYNNMKAKQKVISKMRIRVIAFRDYLADGADAMLVSNFFDMPEQSEQLKQCVELLKAEGGGDVPEDGLEALAYAIKSKWGAGRGKEAPRYRCVDGRADASPAIWQRGKQLSVRNAKEHCRAW